MDNISNPNFKQHNIPKSQFQMPISQKFPITLQGPNKDISQNQMVMVVGQGSGLILIFQTFFFFLGGGEGGRVISI